MTSLSWDTAAEWDANQSEDPGVTHESVTNTDHTSAARLQQGYSYGAPNYPTGLVGYYTFNEDSGSTLYDHSGNAHDATIGGAALGAPGLLGTSAQNSDGTDDYWEIPDNADFDFTSAFTILGWIKYETQPADYARIVGKDHNTSYVFDVDNSSPHNLRLEAFDSLGSYNSTIPIETSVWKLYGLTYSDANGRLRFWGDKKYDEIAVSGQLATDTNPIRIGGQGSDSSGGAIDGSVGLFWFYNRELSVTETRTLHDIARTAQTFTTSTKTS